MLRDVVFWFAVTAGALGFLVGLLGIAKDIVKKLRSLRSADGGK